MSDTTSQNSCILHLFGIFNEFSMNLRISWYLFWPSCAFKISTYLSWHGLDKFVQNLLNSCYPCMMCKCSIKLEHSTKNSINLTGDMTENKQMHNKTRLIRNKNVLAPHEEKWMFTLWRNRPLWRTCWAGCSWRRLWEPALCSCVPASASPGCSCKWCPSAQSPPQNSSWEAD